MEPGELGKSYDKIAHLWNNEEFNRNNGIQQHERALQFLKKKQHALDIGCGSSGRLIDLLLGHGFEVEGVDISEKMLELARERHPDCRFSLADITRWPFPRKYDFITAWDSIWHLPMKSQEPVLRKICTGLNSGGVFIFTTGGLDKPEEKTDFSMGPEVHYSVLGIAKTLEILANSGCVCRHLEYDQYPELHLYIIAQKI